MNETKIESALKKKEKDEQNKKTKTVRFMVEMDVVHTIQYVDNSKNHYDS